MNKPATPIRVVWPPPGLESSQGILWMRARELAVGGSILAFPLLSTLTWSQPFNSLGFFGTAWWVLSLTSLLGLLIVARALGSLLAFFIRSRRVSIYGMDLETILQVAADNDGEMGALLQGTRSYRSLGETERMGAVRARIWAAVAFLSAAAWITVGCISALILASRAFLGPTGLWVLALAPSGVALLGGLTAKGIEGTALKSAHGPFFWNRWSNAGQTEAARLWSEGMKRNRLERGDWVAPKPALLAGGALSVLALGAFVFLPTASFTLASSVGPVMASMAVPRFSSVAAKAGAAEALRGYRLPTTPDISPLEAGEALHAIVAAGRAGPTPEVMAEPVRSYERPFLSPERSNPLDLSPSKWPTELFPLVRRGLSPEGEAYLREVASHPGLVEFKTLARAQAVDVLGGRLVLPFPDELMAMEIPIPRTSRVREGAYALTARAAVQFLDGDPMAAKRTLELALSAGFLLGEDSPSLIDTLVGYVLVANAGDALEGLYDAAGWTEQAEELKQLRNAATRAAELASGGSVGRNVEAALEKMPKKVTSDLTIRGIRWEYFHLLSGLSPCINPQQVVFGPDESWTTFMETAREGLVRYPAEEAVFQLMEKGWFNLPAGKGLEGALVGAVRATLGPRVGSCAGVLASGII